ncbi:MAG: hypothetical protein LBK99_02460 [Opitutaceae bacterium]|jgi:hypothetical protein|nr:hypothetical protein [Opitutaceae bacterium]
MIPEPVRSLTTELLFRSLTLIACTLATAPFSHAEPLLNAPELAISSLRFAKQGQSGKLETWDNQPTYTVSWDGPGRPTYTRPKITLETGNPIHVLKPGDEQKLGLRIEHNPGRNTPEIIEYSITGPNWNDPSGPVRKIGMNDSGDMFIPLPAPPAFGAYKINVRRVQDGHTEESTLSHAYMNPAGPTEGLSDGFIFGVCGHPQRYSREEQELEAMAAAWCGVKAMREDVGWGRIQRKPDEWNFASFDSVVDIFGQYGIEVMPIYTWTPGWAIAKGWTPLMPERRPTAPPDLDHWRAFVHKFTDRYRDRIRFAEIWNEPDHYSFANFPTSHYIKMLEIGYDEIRKTAPHWKVFNGGITTIPVPDAKAINPETLPSVIRSGKYDILAFHGHGVFPGYKSRIERLASFGNRKPWYANETAVSSMVTGENGQARTLFQKLIFSWAKGAIGYNWYNLRNKGRNPKDNEHNFGLVTRDFYPKPVYVAYNSLVLSYSGAQFVRDLSTETPTACLYLFKGKSGDYLIPSWTSSKTDLGVPVSNITGKATRIDLWGNETPLPMENGKVILPISGEPSTLRIVGQSTEPVIAKAKSLTKQASDNITGLALPAYGFSEQPTVVLEESSQVVSTMINDPTTAHLFWKGPDDLSAKVWVGKTRNALKFKILVRDDIHVQPSSGAAISERDSVQVMLDLKQNSIWDFGLAHRVDKGSGVQVFLAPKPFNKETVASNVVLNTKRDETAKTTLYELEIPFSAVDLNQATAATHGIGFNVIVNDNDGDKRESFMSIVPDEERFREAEYFPTISFNKER